MSTLQQQARALGDPTRHAIFRYVAEAEHAVDVAELTKHFGFNHNAIRQHLAKLVRAGLVVETSAPASGRGRPKLIYRVAPSAESRWGVVGPYERLSWLLAEVVRTGNEPVDVGRRAITPPAPTPSPSGVDPTDPVDALVLEMERQGFEPSTHRRGDEVEIVLQVCPFVSTALVDPETVCSLHLGMAIGVADRTTGLVVDELVPHDPRRANCRLRCHVEPSHPH